MSGSLPRLPHLLPSRLRSAHHGLYLGRGFVLLLQLFPRRATSVRALNLRDGFSLLLELFSTSMHPRRRLHPSRRRLRRVAVETVDVV